MSRNDDAIRAQVHSLMAEVADPDHVWNADDLVAAGIPRRYATSLARESVRVADAETARAVADDYADEIITDLHRFDGASPRDLAANIGPW
jgi:hypothetical protein